MSTELLVPARFCGPPGAGNGGWVCGSVAAALPGGTVEVTLSAPAPLEQPLRLEADGDEARLLDGERPLARARRVADGLGEPPPASYGATQEAARALDVEDYRQRHAFPGCFTCGPDRPPGEGLGLFPGQGGGPGRVTWPWTPVGGLGDAAGLVVEPVVWAALDCPSGQAWLVQDAGLAAVVLGRMTAAVQRRPTVGEPLLVQGWSEGRDGRKLRAGAALRTADGELLAQSRTTWIAMDADQLASFRAR